MRFRQNKKQNKKEQKQKTKKRQKNVFFLLGKQSLPVCARAEGLEKN